MSQSEQPGSTGQGYRFPNVVVTKMGKDGEISNRRIQGRYFGDFQSRVTSFTVAAAAAATPAVGIGSFTSFAGLSESNFMLLSPVRLVRFETSFANHCRDQVASTIYYLLLGPPSSILFDI